MGQDVQGKGVLRRGLRLTCPAGEVHTPIASGIQHKREAAEAVVGAVRVQTLAIDAVHFVLTLVLVYPYTRTEQSFRLADMSNVTLSLPKWGPQGLLPPPLSFPGRVPGSLLSRPGPVAWAAATTLGAAARLSLCAQCGACCTLRPSYQHTQACWSHRSSPYGRSTCSPAPCSNTVRCGRTRSQISHTRPCLREGWREGESISGSRAVEARRAGCCTCRKPARHLGLDHWQVPK